MFDFNTSPAKTSALAGVAMFFGAQMADAAVDQQDIHTEGVFTSTSGVAAVYEDLFAPIGNASKVTFNADGGETGILTRFYTDATGVATAVSTVELQVDGAWVLIDTFNLASSNGTYNEISILGQMYDNFIPGDLTGVRLSITPNIDTNYAYGQWTVLGSPANLLVETIPEPASAGLLACGVGLVMLRRRRDQSESVVTLTLDKNPEPRDYSQVKLSSEVS